MKQPEDVLLDAREVCKSFDRRLVLDGIGLRVHRGESVALLGANGCGKSTFLKCCNRLVTADSGSIRFLDREMCALGPGSRVLRQLRTRMGFVFQKHNLVPRLSALSNVIHGTLGSHSGPRYWLQSLAPMAIREKALGCLEQVGMAHLAGQNAGRLSGGESQRVAIARALMQDPVLCFADEPVASLDPRVGHEVMELFANLVKERHLGLLFVSHDLDHALEYAQRIVAFRQGKVVLDCPADKASKKELRRIYD